MLRHVSAGDPDPRLRWELLNRTPELIKKGFFFNAVQVTTDIALRDTDELLRADAVLRLGDIAQAIQSDPSSQYVAERGAIEKTLRVLSQEDSSAYVAEQATNTLRLLT